MQVHYRDCVRCCLSATGGYECQESQGAPRSAVGLKSLQMYSCELKTSCAACR